MTSGYGTEWEPLVRALRRLATSSHGSLAFVVDTGNILWCAAPSLAREPQGAMKENLAATEVYEAEIEPRIAPLRRGERFNTSRDESGARYYACSFAATYVLAVWFEEPFDLAVVAAEVERALPKIKELVLGLPPLGGPGSDAGAVKVRA